LNGLSVEHAIAIWLLVVGASEFEGTEEPVVGRPLKGTDCVPLRLDDDERARCEFLDGLPIDVLRERRWRSKNKKRTDQA
jgi:hypothetical protein